MPVGYPKRATSIELDGTDVSSNNPLPVSLASTSTVSAVLGAGDLTIDAWGNPKVTQPFSLFHSLWTFDVSDKQWIIEEDGVEVSASVSTRVISEGGKLKVSSGATAGDVTEIHSKRHPRYQPNRGHLYSTAVILPDPTNDGVRDFGVFTPENGVFFRLKSDGKLYAVLKSDSVDVLEEEITIPFDFDVSKGNIYDIQYQWRGVGNYKFYIGNPSEGVSQWVHTFNLLGTLTDISIQNPALPATYKSTNTTEEVIIYSGCVDITSEGGADEKQYYTSAVNTSVTVSSNTPILAIRQPATINGNTNTRDALLARITINASKKANISLWITRDATAVTGGSWSAIQGSYVEQNKTATSVTTAKMSLVTQFNVEALVSKEVTNPNKDIIQFWLVHGDYIVLTGSGASSSVDAVIEFGEEL